LRTPTTDSGQLGLASLILDVLTLPSLELAILELGKHVVRDLKGPRDSVVGVRPHRDVRDGVDPVKEGVHNPQTVRDVNDPLDLIVVKLVGVAEGGDRSVRDGLEVRLLDRRLLLVHGLLILEEHLQTALDPLLIHPQS